MLGFYGIIGFEFVNQKIDKGSEIHRAHRQNIEFALYSLTSATKSSAPTLQLGFRVSEIEQIVAKLSTVPGALCIMEPTQMPDGKKAIILDPDGNSVELCENT